MSQASLSGQTKISNSQHLMMNDYRSRNQVPIALNILLDKSNKLPESFKPVSNFREVFNKPMPGGRWSTVDQDFLSSFIYPFTNDNKCLHHAPADFCQDSNIL
jgi:hypothetical protein